MAIDIDANVNGVALFWKGYHMQIAEAADTLGLSARRRESG